MPNLFHRLGAALRGNPLENPAVPLSSPAAWLLNLFGGSPTSAGVAVNEHSAMQHTTVYACINVLASSFSSLPCKVYERTAKGKSPAFNSDLYYLLAVEPNPEMSAVTFWGAMMACAALRGNGYAIIQWDPKQPNVPIALWPVHPSHVKPQRNEQKMLEYVVTVDGVQTTYKPKDILHVPALTMDGFVGIDPIMAAKQSIGTGIAAAKHIGGFFGRGSRPSGLLTRTSQPTTPGTLGAKTPPEAMDQVRESWERANSGESQGRTAVLPAGWEWKAISITPEQAQQIQVMGFTRTELCGLWMVPPHMAGDTSRLSNSNHESQALEFVTWTLRPWIMRFEAEIQRKLMPKVGRNAGIFSVRFDTTELIRGDFNSMMTGFSIGKQWGFFNSDEIREKIGENPIGGPAGKEYLVPLNMVPASKLMDDPDPDADPDKNVTPGDDQDPDDVPAGNGGRNQRKLLDRMADGYRRLFRDAAGRLQARNVRDAAVVQQIFGPVLASIADESVSQARSLFRLPAEIDLGTEKLLRETAKQLEKRAATWTATTADADGVSSETLIDQALTYCVRSICLHVYREAGSTIALKA